MHVTVDCVETSVARRAVGHELGRLSQPLAEAALAMARRFVENGRLFCCGADADAQHVAVEFLHPVVVGKRALPALQVAHADDLRLLATGRDMLLLIDRGGTTDAMTRVTETVHALEMLTVVLGDPHTSVDADHVLHVASGDPLIARELHVTLYHVLWELVHVFREHPELAR